MSESYKLARALDTGLEALVTTHFKAMRAVGQELQLAAQLVGTGPDGAPTVAYVMRLGEMSTDEFVEGLRDVARGMGAIYLAVVAEAWTGRVPGTRPSEDPMREEALILSVHGACGQRTVTWPILSADGQLGPPTRMTGAQSKFDSVLADSEPFN